MSKLILLFAVLALTSIAFATTSEEASTLWEAWKTAHNKRYLSSEEDHRFMVFQENVAKIAKLNAEYVGAKFATNLFSDLTSEEFKQKFTTDLVGDQTFNEEILPSPITEGAPLPDSFDWRTKGAVTPVKYQGGCGSCWAFVTVAALESLNIIANNNTRPFGPDFSEQQMIDCGNVIGGGLNGCKGGQLQPAFNYAIQYGLMSESYYPYTATDGNKCYYFHRFSQVVASTIYGSPYGMPEALKSNVLRNPVVVYLQGDQDVMQHYKSGVISTGCGTARNHAGLVVGYQKVNGQEAFIVKNSWGSWWGVDGYAYISTDPTYNNGLGACGLLYYPLFPSF